MIKYIKKYDRTVSIIIVVVLSYINESFSFDDYLSMTLTMNFLTIFILLPTLVLFSSYDGFDSSLVRLRMGLNKYKRMKLKTILSNSMMIVLYFLLMLFRYKGNADYVSLIAILLYVIIVYIIIYKIAFILSIKKKPIYLSIFIGLFYFILSIIYTFFQNIIFMYILTLVLLMFTIFLQKKYTY